MSQRHPQIAILPLLFLLCPTPAHAWIQTTTCDESVACEEGETPMPSHWETPCVAFHLNENGSSDIPDFDSIVKIVENSIETWNLPEKSSLNAHYAGLTNENRIGFNPYTDRNANIIVFRDDNWSESRAIMALTTITQNRKTGEIFDADIEINTQHYKFGIVNAASPHVVDLQNTLTHELGHAFGLAHSDVASATMFPYSGTGDTSLVTLDDDDVDAISSIYPPTELTCQFDDRFFEAPPFAMDEPPPASDSCSAAPYAPHRSPFFAFFIALSAIFLSIFQRKFYHL